VRDGSSDTVKIGDGGTFSTFRFNATQVAPNNNNNCILGASSLRWSTIYGVLGNFSGALTVGGLTAVGNISQTDGDLLYSGGGNWDLKHTTASQNIVFSTTPSGGSATERARITHDGHLSFENDSAKIKMGLSGDLEIYHDGSNSYINDTGTGALFLKTNYLAVAGANGNQLINAEQGAAVELYHNNSKKLETTASGVTVTGLLTATTKSFTIDHPTKPGKKLRHGSLEGPENGVYIRGKSNSKVVELPEYWTKLVNKDSITVQLTPIGKHQHIYVESIENNIVKVQSDETRKNNNNNLEYFYFIQAERIDVDKLEVEIDE
jgi:hypothetical protein